MYKIKFMFNGEDAILNNIFGMTIDTNIDGDIYENWNYVFPDDSLLYKSRIEALEDVESMYYKLLDLIDPIDWHFPIAVDEDGIYEYIIEKDED